MRIGILTYHRAVNYGAVMQSYSLSGRIARDFPDASVEIIDFNPKARERFKLKCPLVFTYRRGLGAAWKKAVQTRVFNKFVKRLPVGKKMLSKSFDTIEKYMSENYDVVIVGSDAVFNWNDIGIPNPYFLGNTRVKKKLSYAASSHLQFFGNVSEEQKKYLKSALCDFDYIGVRDESTRDFVKGATDGEKEASHNCDPTIFLDMNFPKDNLDSKLKKHKFDRNKKTVFVMLMHPEYAEYTRRYFGEDVQIVALMDSNPHADIYLHDLNPFEWAHVFSYGDMLITDYFHGTILGLKNGIPVLSIDASRYCKDGYESKAHDLLFKRLDYPTLYVNADELKGEGGYARFAEAVDGALGSFDKERLMNAISKEALAYENFAVHLKGVLNS